MKNLPHVTHTYGPWSPARFIPIPFHKGTAPAFWITTNRMCTGIHDWRCTQTETQTFGPLVLEGATEADLYRCLNCARVQPPVHTASTGEEPVCLYCTDLATVQHFGDGREATSGLTAVAALHGASATIRAAKDTAADGYLALLDDTADYLAGILDDAAWAIRQQPARARYSGNATLVVLARQIIANARTLHDMLNTEPELLPVKENEGE